ncbi:MAG: hypothetical protein DCF31_11455 [Alphaproteobacteria bacterium]|nr:MAG: hypothetical protein DCF31_11455 [Alphaproteobacteria bacterium]
MMKSITVLMGLAAISALSAPAAAAVTYAFTAYSSIGSPNYRGGWVFTAPDFVTAALRVEPAALDSCFVEGDGDTPSCGRQRFVPDQPTSGPDGTVFTDVILFGVLSPIESGSYPYYFPGNAFATPGTYDSIVLGAEQRGRLVVTGPPAVPDAPAWAMLIAGFGLTGAALRRQSAIAQHHWPAEA